MEAIASPTIVAWVWQPAISPLHIFGLTAILAALAIFAYARSLRSRPLASAGLLLMRLAVIAALGILLMGPSAIPPRIQHAGRSKLLIFADTSASMLTGDCEGTSRFEFARRNWLSRDRLQKLAEHYELQCFGFDAEVRPLSPAMLENQAKKLATGWVSRIAESLRTSIQEIDEESSESALLVLSDGHDSDQTPMLPVALLAKARGVPVHAVCFGGSTLQRDLALVAYPEQQYLLAGEMGQIVAKIHQAGLGQTRTTLRVQCGKEDLSRKIEFDGKDCITVKLPVKQQAAGLYEYKISVDPVTGESEKGNNVQTVFMEVTKQRIKVLLLEGEPFWDTKFIAQSLRKDARIDLMQIVQLSEQRTQRIVSAARKAPLNIPTTPQAMAEYNVIILGRGIEHMLDRKTAKLLPDFVSKHGGHIVFARGRSYDAETPLGRQLGRDIAVLEPVVWARGLKRNLSLQVTPAGRSSPCFAFEGMTSDPAQTVAQLPGFSVMPAVAREKAATIVLATAMPPGRAMTDSGDKGIPALVSMSYGRGRVVAVLGEGLWRWAFLPPRMAMYDGVYDVFWSNLIRWLATGSDFLPGQEVSLKLARSSVRLNDPMLIDVACKYAPKGGFHPRLTVSDSDGKQQELSLKRLAGMSLRLQTTFTGKKTGIYTAVLECPQLRPPKIERKFSIYNVDLERLRTSAKPEAMRVLAEQSGGLFLQPDQAHKLPEQMAKLRALRVVPQRPDFIWDKALFLVVLLLWAGGEWLARKRAGLL